VHGRTALALTLLAAMVLGGCSGPTPGTPSTPSGAPSSSGGPQSPSPSPTMSATSATTWAAMVRAENTQPGAPGWRIPSTRGKAQGLDAYADRVSVRPGDPVGLYVSARGPVAVRALRVGDYAGRGARQVWAGTLTARLQPKESTDEAAIPDAGGISHTHLVVAPWHRTGEVDTTGWPEGDYLLRLDAGPASRYVPVTVRSADARGRVLLIAGAMTWEAYNHWGGSSLYDGDDNTFGNRSHAVSFDRPYDDGYGSGRFEMFDAPLARLADHDGLPLAWATDYDVANDPALLDGAAAIVIGGHAEYWTAPMRDAVTRAVAAGSNLAVFGANTAYWRVRLAGRSTGLAAQPDRRDGRPRVIVGAKSSGLDPLAAHDPGGATARFRDPPHARSEQALTGMRYDCFPAETSWTVADPTWWGYTGTGVTSGEKLAGVVGPEADRVYPASDRPTPEQIVAYQPYACGKDHTAHTGVYWVAASGAAVFTTGTMRWVCALDVGCTGVPGHHSAAVLARVTTNVLTAFAVPRAGQSHPAHDTVGRFKLSATATTHAT
jgi:hypothetical protein